MNFKKSFIRMVAVFFTTALFLTGCDRILVKRIDLQRPIDPSQIRMYEENKAKIVLAIDRVASVDNLSCTSKEGFIRFCTRYRAADKLVVFEEKQGFSTCFIVDGTPFDDNEFVQFASILEKALSDSVQGTKLIISPIEKLPECVFPPYNNRNNP